MSLLPSVEQELMRVARAPVGGGAARIRVPAIGRPRVPGAVLAVAVSVVAVMIGAGFLVALRSAHGGGGPIAQRPPTRPPGHATVPGAPRASRGHFTDRGMYVCRRAPRNRYLPHDAGCVSVLRAAMTGPGATDLVLLYADLGHHRVAGGYVARRFTLEVVRPGAAIVRTRVQSDPLPWIVRMGNINELPGDELILHLDDISSGDTYGIYTFHSGRIELVKPLLSAGGDSADKEGFACEKLGPSATLTSQLVTLIGPTIHGRWRWTVTKYAWRGPTLRRVGRRTFVRHGAPPRAITYAGGLCGRPTGATQTDPR